MYFDVCRAPVCWWLQYPALDCGVQVWGWKGTNLCEEVATIWNRTTTCLWWSLCMPGHSYCRQLRPFLLCLCEVFWVPVNSLGRWFWRNCYFEGHRHSVFRASTVSFSCLHVRSQLFHVTKYQMRFTHILSSTSLTSGLSALTCITGHPLILARSLTYSEDLWWEIPENESTIPLIFVCFIPVFDNSCTFSCAMLMHHLNVKFNHLKVADISGERTCTYQRNSRFIKERERERKREWINFILERERERQTDRQTDRQTETDRLRQTETDRLRERDRDRETEIDTEKRQRDRDRQREETERQRQTQRRDRETEIDTEKRQTQRRDRETEIDTEKRQTQRRDRPREETDTEKRQRQRRDREETERCFQCSCLAPVHIYK